MESSLRMHMVTRLEPIFLPVLSLFQVFHGAFKLPLYKLGEFYFLRFNFMVSVFINYHLLDVWCPHSSLFVFCVVFFFSVNFLSFIVWPSCHQMPIEWNNRNVLSNPSVLHVCLFSRCRFAQLNTLSICRYNTVL